MRVDRNVGMAEYVYRKLSAEKDADGRHVYVMAHPLACTNVCFWYVPPALRAAVQTKKAVAALAEGSDTRHRLQKAAPFIKDRMQVRVPALS